MQICCTCVTSIGPTWCISSRAKARVSAPQRLRLGHSLLSQGATARSYSHSSPAAGPRTTRQHARTTPPPLYTRSATDWAPTTIRPTLRRVVGLSRLFRPYALRPRELRRHAEPWHGDELPAARSSRSSQLPGFSPTARWSALQDERDNERLLQETVHIGVRYSDYLRSLEGVPAPPTDLRISYEGGGPCASPGETTRRTRTGTSWSTGYFGTTTGVLSRS